MTIDWPQDGQLISVPAPEASTASSCSHLGQLNMTSICGPFVCQLRLQPKWSAWAGEAKSSWMETLNTGRRALLSLQRIRVASSRRKCRPALLHSWALRGWLTVRWRYQMRWLCGTAGSTGKTEKLRIGVQSREMLVSYLPLTKVLNKDQG